MDRMIHEEITERVIASAFLVHQTLGYGFLESVYKRALRLELEQAGFPVTEELPIDVLYKGAPVGKFYADLFVDGKVIVELKSVERLVVQHEVQLVNYLKATGIETGLLLNFGPTRVEIKRKFLNTIPANPDPSC